MNIGHVQNDRQSLFGGGAYRSDDTRAVRADQASLVLGLEDVGDADHVYIRSISSRAFQAVQVVREIRTVLGDTLSNAVR
jgi:Ni,Fe-hydrogenase III component G